jgi:hypothetical protein
MNDAILRDGNVLFQNRLLSHGIRLERLGKPHEKSKDNRYSIEIRTAYLSASSLERYLYGVIRPTLELNADAIACN